MDSGAALTGPAARARELALELTSSPRLAGTVGSLRGAETVSAVLSAAGWSVRWDERDVLLSLPRRLSFAAYEDAADEHPYLASNARFDADAIPPGDVPIYSAWSASGEVRAPVVDVGYGLRADFERLRAAGIEVRGAIALARYGRAYRGVKVDLAAEYGCVGVLLFSARDDDGPGRGPVWPEGPWKPGWAAQRGSISPMARVPGDPSTPGWASPQAGAPGRRLDAAQLEVLLPRIPCLPIGEDSAAAIRSLLAVQRASEAGDDKTADPQPVGPGPVEVRLALDVPRTVRRVRNVIATLGGELDDAGRELVIAGSHRDAWVRGAQDSGSGCVALLLAAEELGRRVHEGWTPGRTLVLGFWDAEEFGLIGSTEWAEAHEAHLARRALAYVNADASVAGTRVSVSGSPGLLGTVQRVLRRVAVAPRDAASGPGNLWEQWLVNLGQRPVELGLPGSGSDHAVFVHHLGIPVLELGFGGNGGGQYHTVFDDFPVMDRFLDPGWQGHALAASALSALLGELADNTAPFDAAEACEALAQHARRAGAEVARDEHAWLGGERGERLARAFESAAQRARTARASADVPRTDEARLYRALTVPGGLEGREWFVNDLWTPGLETGYSSETFPALRSAAARGPAALDRALAELEARLQRLGAGPEGAPR